MADEDLRQPDAENPFAYMLDEAFNGVLRGLMVCLPGRIMVFDASTQRAQVQCGIRKIVDGQPTTIPVIQNVTVCFPGNNGWYMWHEITPGETEGLIHFSQRAVDTWINSGGVTTPVDFRMFSEQDAFFAPGFRSQPGAIPSLPTEGMGMSSYDGATRISMTDGAIEWTAGGSTMTLDSSGLTVDGNAIVNGDTSLNGTVESNGTNIGDDHTHSGVESGPDNSGPPT